MRSGSRHTSHANSVDILVGLGTLNSLDPELVDVVSVCGVIPCADTKQVPFDRNTTGHGLLVAGAHNNTVPVSQNLVRMIVNGERAVKSVNIDKKENKALWVRTSPIELKMIVSIAT